MKNKKGKGWYNHPYEHALASKGIRTSDIYTSLHHKLGHAFKKIGVKTGVGDISYGDIVGIEEILDKVRNEYSEEKELGVVLLKLDDNKLQVFDVIRGEEERVRKNLPNKDFVVIHTHPNNRPWSSQDIYEILNNPKYTTSYIIGPNSVYVAYQKNKESIEISLNEIEEEIKDIAEKIEKFEGNISPYQLGILFNDSNLGKYLDFEGGGDYET